MKSTKYRKWRLSKRRFPTFEVYGMNGPGSGSLSIGRDRAAEFLGRTLTKARVDKMRVTDTRSEWVFMEAVQTD